MLKIAILGFGGRGAHYANICKKQPRDFNVVAVIDNSDDKLSLAKSVCNLADNQLFKSLDDFLVSPKIADYLFVCTHDADHKKHSIPALEKGYNLLLEKPIATTIDDCLDIYNTAKKLKREVAVCHVLRHSSYFEKIKEITESGVLGKIIAIEQIENVAFWHQAHSFIRGDWRKKSESAPMIITKCCHDLDTAVFLADSKCKSVNSIGKLHYFNAENAPEGSTEYCVGGCKCKDSCPYDAEKLYVERAKKFLPAIRKHLWPQSRLMSDSIVTIPKLQEAIKTSRYGKCVFHSDNDVVDYQTTTMIFENGITSTLTMTAFSGEVSSRETRVRGALGELICNMGKNTMHMEIYGKKIKKIKFNVRYDAHGGGDVCLLKSLASGKMKTDISMAIESHLIGFCAEESRLADGATIHLDEVR